MGPTKKKSQKTGSQVLKESREQEALQKATLMQQKAGERKILDQLQEFFEANPAVAASTLANIQAGLFETAVETDQAEQKLPNHMNKFRLLGKEQGLELLGSFLPQLAKWLASGTGASKALSRIEVANVLAFVTGMDQGSAVQCKTMGRLKRKLRERWEKLGCRGEKFQCQPEQTLKDSPGLGFNH